MSSSLSLPSLFFMLALPSPSPSPTMNPISTFSLLLLLLLLLPLLVAAQCTCKSDPEEQAGGTGATQYKVAAIVSILASGLVGVALPILGKRIPALRLENDVFLAVKAFATGVILATGFVHVLPDAFESLTSPCLGENPWGRFPFGGFVAMISAVGTMMIDAFATGFYQRSQQRKAQPVEEDEEMQCEGRGHVHGSGFVTGELGSLELARHRVIARVLELGIVIHSMIIGISLGASGSPNTIKPLVAALSFHQFFEGMGLGGCISQAKFKFKAIGVMVAFFSLTTPVGVAVGMGVSSMYNENSPGALVVEGLLNSASAGILIYMALVDLVAADFMSPRMQSNFKLQVTATLLLLLGTACMSLLAKWA